MIEKSKVDSKGTCFNCLKDIEACICNRPEPRQSIAPALIGDSFAASQSSQWQNSRQTGTQVGDVIDDKYEIVGLIGRGGMGKVFKAKHRRIDRFYAIKVLKDDLAEDTTYRGRFEQEAKAASRLEDAHLVAVYDYGMTIDGEPYIVMDFVSGQSLEALIKNNRPLDADLATKIFIQICQGLEHAHQVGIIHRDLKPSNVMLTDSNTRAPVARVLDFGIAKVTDQGHTTSQSLTKTGDVFGSPQYMSPEQCQGGKADKRSDIYSLGCLMFEVLTGYPPFHADNPLATMFQHVHETAPSFIKVNPATNISQNLEQVVFKSLAKDPKDRYQNMTELRAALTNVQAGKEAVSAELPKSNPPKFVAITIGAFILMVLAVFIYFGKQKHDSDALKAEIKASANSSASVQMPTPINQPILQKVERPPQTNKSDEGGRKVTSTPAKIPPSDAKVQAKQQPAAVSMHEPKTTSPEKPKLLSALIAKKPVGPRAEDFYKMACQYIAAQKYGEAVSYLDEAIKMNPNKSDFFRQRAFAYMHLNRYSQAVADYDRVINKNPQEGSAYARRANALIMLNQSDRALADLGLAENYGVRKDIVAALKGRAYHESNEHLRAVWSLKEAIRLGSREYSNYEMLAEDLSALGNNVEALKVADQAKQLEPASPWAYVFRAEVFEAKKDYKSAIQELESASRVPQPYQGSIQARLNDDRALNQSRGGVKQPAANNHSGSRKLKRVSKTLWEMRP